MSMCFICFSPTLGLPRLPNQPRKLFRSHDLISHVNDPKYFPFYRSTHNCRLEWEGKLPILIDYLCGLSAVGVIGKAIGWLLFSFGRQRKPRFFEIVALEYFVLFRPRFISTVSIHYRLKRSNSSRPSFTDIIQGKDASLMCDTMVL